MRKGIKKGGAARKQSTVESPSVTSPGMSKKDSPLAGFQWRPGESGNPAGRPKTSDLKAEVRAFADEADPRIRKTRLRVWLEMADRRARQGSPKHLEMLLAYGWGRPSQELDANINHFEMLSKARARHEEMERQRLAALTPEERETLARLNSKMGDALIPAATPTNGHSDAATAQAAALLPDQDLSTAREDDAEAPAQPALPQKPKRVVAY